MRSRSRAVIRFFDIVAQGHVFVCPPPLRGQTNTLHLTSWMSFHRVTPLTREDGRAAGRTTAKTGEGVTKPEEPVLTRRGRLAGTNAHTVSRLPRLGLRPRQSGVAPRRRDSAAARRQLTARSRLVTPRPSRIGPGVAPRAPRTGRREHGSQCSPARPVRGRSPRRGYAGRRYRRGRR